MREIVLDTETTGIGHDRGHRLVEIGCLELENHIPTGRFFHRYVNPERLIEEEAIKVHGITDSFVADKPLFAEIVEKFLAFTGDAPLIIHNAPFDMGFINMELKRVGRPPLPMTQAIDTLEMARSRFPGAQNSLDALCRRFGVDNSGRSKHGALLDSELLAEVYLELVGGRQIGLGLLGTGVENTPVPGGLAHIPKRQPRPTPLASRLSREEEEAHRLFIEAFAAPSLWQTQ